MAELLNSAAVDRACVKALGGVGVSQQPRRHPDGYQVEVSILEFEHRIEAQIPISDTLVIRI